MAVTRDPDRPRFSIGPGGPIISRYVCYHEPFTASVLVCFERHEPTVPGQKLSHVDHALSISGLGSVLAEVPCGDPVPGPAVLEPGNSPLDERLCNGIDVLGALDRRRPSLIQSLKQVRHRRSPLVCVLRSPRSLVVVWGR